MVEPEKPRTPTQTYFLGFIAFVVLAAVLYYARPVVLPVVVALFLAVLVRPLHRRLKRVVPSSVSLALVSLAVGLLLVAIPAAFAANIDAILAKLPDYAPRIHAIVEDVHDFALRLGVDIAQLDLDPVASLKDFGLDALTSGVTFFGNVVLILFTMLFILSEAEIFRDKLAVAFNPSNEARLIASVVSVRALITQYVATKTLIAFLSGLAAGAVTLALGVDFPFVWGVLTFMLYYIPNVGSMLAVIPPFLLAIIQFDGPTRALVLLAVLIVVFNLVGNVLEPRLMGRTLSLSPLIVFVSLIFWGWFWGFVGVVLAVPLTVVTKILCEHIEVLRPVAVLMSNSVDDHRGGPPPPAAPPRR
ncbi:MAG: AI-2E family transporter [Deltaproteobacteria bacterium]|nr:AI-2E family transporter [Deltaproteobacteria bacterium]